MSKRKRERAPEQAAVNTTIVGGRPPGCGKPVGDIPRGIEVLVKKASVDPEFKELLLTKRAAAAAEIDLHLDPAEAAMLAVVPAGQLETIVANTVVEPAQRSAFMGRAAKLMLVALGASILTGCPAVSDGARPERPAPAENANEAPSRGVRPDRPDRPGPERPAAEENANGPVSKGIRPDRPTRLEPTDGIRPDMDK